MLIVIVVIIIIKQGSIFQRNPKWPTYISLHYEINFLKKFQDKFLLISVDPSEHGGGADICDKPAEVLDDDNEE